MFYACNKMCNVQKKKKKKKQFCKPEDFAAAFLKVLSTKQILESWGKNERKGLSILI